MIKMNPLSWIKWTIIELFCDHKEFVAHGSLTGDLYGYEMVITEYECMKCGKIVVTKNFSGTWMRCEKCRQSELVEHSEFWKKVLEVNEKKCK